MYNFLLLDLPANVLDNPSQFKVFTDNLLTRQQYDLFDLYPLIPSHRPVRSPQTCLPFLVQIVKKRLRFFRLSQIILPGGME